MGRLNYTNRKIDGIKLGRVVAKDLVKRIPPALGSKAALRDPIVEIDLRSKQLTDAGFLEVTAGLVESIQYEGPQGKVVLLEEICLGDCGLTVSSLHLLTSIIDLAAASLRDLDLSNNSISINDADAILQWEAFLQSLSSCCVLRRLDLSGNDLGTKAFEVLARVYAKEEPIDLILPEELESLCKTNAANRADTLEQTNQAVTRTSESDDVDSAGDDKISLKTEKEKNARHVSKLSVKSSNSPEKNGHTISRDIHLPLYATTRGLHSIPYIVLSNTSMKNAAALYLSYILVVHHVPARLLTRVPPAKAGPEQQQLAAYDATHCQGIIYLPNDTLGKDGTKVLDLAEKERHELLEPISPNASSTALQETVNFSDAFIQTSSSIRQSGLITARTHRRRASGSASGCIGSSVAATTTAMSDLDRARSRIQGEELEKTAPYGNDLWRIALNMLCMCRDIQTPAHQVPPQTTQDLHKARPDMSLAKEFPPLPCPSPTRPTIAKPRGPIIKTLEVPGFASMKVKHLPPILPLGTGNPNQAMLPRSTHSRKASVPGVPDTPTIIPPTPLPLTPHTVISIAVARAQSKPYRSNLPCGFTEEAWWKIMGQAASAEGILSKTQQQSVLKWAMDRSTLRRGREWLGEREGNQIWHVLDGMGCLAYETDA